ncbi:MAG: YMGG-like glycine zipper-containing protein [Pyrinomonadaceae bacterium]
MEISIRKRTIAMIFLSITLILSTFAIDGSAQQRRHRRVHHSRTKGAIIGAVVGGVGGGLLGGKKGAVIGAGAGGGTGYLIQRHRNRRHRRRY